MRASSLPTTYSSESEGIVDRLGKLLGGEARMVQAVSWQSLLTRLVSMHPFLLKDSLSGFTITEDNCHVLTTIREVTLMFYQALNQEYFSRDCKLADLAQEIKARPEFVLKFEEIEQARFSGEAE
jgi:hypothetical protein